MPHGVIVETEAYHQEEPASHAYAGLTPRTRTLFGPPGRAYVYRSYGVHALLNAVCEPEGVGAAVLIRALEPTAGIREMTARRSALLGREAREYELCSGPGRLTQALGITLEENGTDLEARPGEDRTAAEGLAGPAGAGRHARRHHPRRRAEVALLRGAQSPRFKAAPCAGCGRR